MQDATIPLSQLNEADFVALLGSIYEHSPWVAERLWQQQCNSSAEDLDSREQVAMAMQTIVDQSSDIEKLTLLRAHPDLAGKAAFSGALTDASQSEQAGAGLDQCSAQELARFSQLNERYRDKFGFPFIMAVKGATKAQIFAGFEDRIPNGWQAEFERALHEVHKIAGFRLAAL